MTSSAADPLPAEPRTHPSHRHRRILLTALLCLSGLIALLASPPAAAAAGGAHPVPVGAAERTVAALTGPDPASALRTVPADFVDVMGYRPLLQDGRPVNPHGSCSSPVPLPGRFEPLCRSHDFGYDLLRYAAATGRPAASWARQVLDAALVRQMNEACTNPLCTAAARVSRTGLALNTWRQHSGTPTAGESLPVIAAGYATRAAESIRSGR